MNLVTQLQNNSRLYPDRPALVDRDGARVTTFAQLDDLSGRVAGKLRALGIRAGQAVMIHMSRGRDAIVTYLGILKAGALVVVTTHEYPAERITYIREHSGAVLIAGDDFSDDLDSYAPVSEPAGGSDPALLVYTSGSTGLPKGVCYTLNELSAHAAECKVLYDNRTDIINASAAQLSFGVHIFEYWSVLLLGGCTHILPEHAIRSVHDIDAYHRKHGINTCYMTPQMLKLYAPMQPCVSHIIAAGERLSGVAPRGFTLINGYGMTETLITTMYRVTEASDNTPIGKALDGVTASIRDGDNNPVPDGTEGEICFDGIFDFCYYRDPERTAKIKEPLPDGRFRIHTGDFGYINENGDIVYVNRHDWMVKINGQRVETMEIEQQLLKLPNVDNAAVKAFTDRDGQTYLTAYCCGGSDLNEEEIRAALAKRLPGYMIPRFIVFMPALPRNTNGKLDRTALMAPDSNDFKADYEAPQTLAEEALCTALSLTLSCGRVGVNDDLIALGCDSIKVLHLIENARLDGLTPDLVLLGRTPKKIAAMLTEKQKDAVITSRENVSECPLNESQRGVYMECIADPDSTMYNVPISCVLPRGTDTQKLMNAIRTAVSVHPAFDAVICLRGAEPVMRKVPHECLIENADVDDLLQAQRAFVRPFDLENGPLYRFAVWHAPEADYFCFDIHHLIFDGSSINVFLEEIARVYNGEAPAGETFTLFDACLSEHERSNNGQDEARGFFDKLLDGADTDCLLTPDAPGDAPGGAGLLCLDTGLDPEEIRRFTREHNITVNTLLMGAFAYTLARFGGAKESLFCTASKGRRDPRLNNTVGMFVRTVPVHVSFTEENGIADYLNSLQDTFFSSLRYHNSITFSELVQKYGIGNRISFIYQGELFSGSQLSVGPLTAAEFRRGETQSDLIFMVLHRPDRYALTVHYRTNVYTEALLRRFARVFETVVRGMLTRHTLGEVPLTDAAEEALLASFAGRKVPYDDSRTVVDLFVESARRYPEREAVIFEDKRMTYAQLDDMTDRLAAELTRRGISREQVVSVLIPRSEWMAIASLGVLKAGAAYQPLDASYPPERLAFMMEDAGAKLLIADKSLLTLVPEHACPVLLTDEITALPPAGKPDTLPGPDDLFMLLYTSGSTGVPKGSMIEHRNVAAFCGWVCRDYHMTENDRVLAYASYGFDANLMDMYPTWMSGAALYIASEELRLDLPRLSDYIRENGICHAFMTTQVGRMVATQQRDTGLRTLMMGGEKLVPFQPKPGCRYLNGYGPSECVCASSVYEITRLEEDLPIGRPLDNLELYVLDAQGRRMPVGVPGELCISGPQVSRGYLNRPEKTAEAFVRNPFRDEAPYLRMYRTGDVVCWLPDGNLRFIGRRDAQVKVRGFRVELTEVEAVIRDYPGIADATVAAFDEPGGGKYIAAYVVSDETVDTDALHAFIRTRKPAYMVPAVTMQLPAIPLNQNAKVNKKALPVPQRKAENILPPETEIQRRIFDLCAEVIGHTAFGIDTDLFDAGLTSIGTLRLNVMLGEAFHTSLRIDDLKRSGTVRSLEKLLSGAGETAARALQADYPITQTQQGIFVECSANPGSVLYNIPLLMKLNGSVDCGRLIAAVRAAIDAHPYLKATLFADENGAIRARRQDDAEPVVQHIMCDTLPDRETLVQPFRMLNAPLYRAAVYTAGQDTWLFIDTHHILSDGTSEAVLLQDIDRAYAGGSLSAETYTGFDAALDEEEARGGERYQKAKAWYDSVFAGCESDVLPPKSPEDPEGGAASVIRRCAMPAERVLKYCEEHKLTVNALMNAAFGFTLSRFSLLKDVVFTTVYNGRSDSRLANAVTMLVKTLPVLVRADNDRPVADLIRETQDQLMNSMASDLYSFAEVSAAYGIRSDILLVYQGDSFRFDTLCGAPAESVPVLPDVAKALLSVSISLVNGCFELAADYRRDHYSAAFIHALLDALEQVIAGFTEKTVLSEVSMMSETAEKRIADMNDTARPFENIPVARLFEKYAAAQPDCPAVTDRERSMTYAELDRAANRAAHALIGLGVKRDTVVCLLMNRTIDISLSELAILKAGGAFLGVLPAYPDDRIDFCLRDASCPIVITSPDVMEAHPGLFGSDKPYRPVTVAQLLENTDESRPEVEIPMDSLSYCIYTSGSTGNPKGVMLEQHNLACVAQQGDSGYRSYCGSDRNQTVLALSAITFDVSVFDNLVCLLNGMTVVIASDEEIHNPGKLAALIIANRVETLVCTPSFMTNYITVPEFRAALKQIRSLVLGAEVFSAALYTRLREILPDAPIVNAYGPSECTITCSCKEIHSADGITIGGPTPNTCLYVMDKWGAVLPPYACGELIILGEQVGRGYANLPERTKASFITLNGRPAYRSGDTVRMNADGEIEFFGRIDNQVKLRGFRIELDEIEKTVCSYPGVKQSKVIIRNNGAEDYLACYFTAESPVDLSALTQYLKSKLTYYMVPDVMAQLDEMPLTPNGKIDKKALPEIRKESRKKGERRAPKKSLEQELCDLFASVLNVEEFYADDNFFEMGGTSLSASKVTMQLMSREYDVEYQDVFDHPTPEELAAFIQARQAPKAKDARPEESDDNPLTDMLRCNTLAHAAEVRSAPLGDVLLTGAVGFLGSHVLRELIDRREGRIICLVRKGGGMDAEERLRSMLMYYFDKPYEEEMRERITVLDADITDETLPDTLRDVRFDTLINCAACVKHYAADDSIERINVHGVENLIRCAKEKGARMIQISTTSVPGVHTEDTYRRQLRMHENELFVVDNMDNKYIISKYQAELKMLEAIRDGLRGKIIRVGNLMGRHSDGEFQINFNTNAFLNALRGFATIGKCPISHATDPMSFSPIDLTARAIVLLAGTNDSFTAFHADSRFGFDEMQLIEAANHCSLTITPVPDEEYYADYYRMLGDDRVNARLQGLVTNDRPDLHMVDTDNLFTANILYRLGFSWPLPDEAYLQRAINSLLTLDYFGDDETEEL